MTRRRRTSREWASDNAKSHNEKEEASKASHDFETGVLSNMLTHEASTNGENGSQVIRVRTWGTRKWRL